MEFVSQGGGAAALAALRYPVSQNILIALDEFRLLLPDFLTSVNCIDCFHTATRAKGWWRIAPSTSNFSTLCYGFLEAFVAKGFVGGLYGLSFCVVASIVL